MERDILNSRIHVKMNANIVYLGLLICLLQASFCETVTHYYESWTSYKCPDPCLDDDESLLKRITRCSLSIECMGVSFNWADKTHCEYSTSDVPQLVPGNMLYKNINGAVCVDDLVEGVPDDHLTASSNIAGNNPSRARLHTIGSYHHRGAWLPATKYNRNDYVQVRFYNIQSVIGIATQGRNNYALQCVTSYKISYSLDCISFVFLRASDNEIVKFPGNSDRDTVVWNYLPTPVIAVCVRIYPITYIYDVALRFGIKGCSL